MCQLISDYCFSPSITTAPWQGNELIVLKYHLGVYSVNNISLATNLSLFFKENSTLVP